jgi:tetratricopeptide (TPR) repeat protein
LTTEILAAAQQKIVAKRFDEALRDLEPLLEAEADNIDALYMCAVCHRYKGEHEAALEVLERLKELMPEHGRAFQEEGHNFRDLGRPDDALLSYARACRFNPALEASWRGQLAILVDKGLEAQAGQVKAQLDWLQSLPKPLVAVIDLVAQGQLLRAEDLCRQFLRKVPHHVEGMRLLADIGMRLGVLDDAEFLLDSAVKLDPENVPARIDLIQVLRKRQKFERALEESQHLLESSPENPQFLSLYAIESMQTGDYDTALHVFDQVLEKLPGDPGTLTSRGHALKTRGDYEAAVEAYRAALASEPGHGEAYYSLANLKIYSFGDAEIASMESQHGNRNLPYMDRVYLNFALGKAFEDAGDFEQSFAYYEQGNRLKKSQSRYDAAQMTADLRAQSEVCTSDFFADREGYGHDAPDPVFILGLPRAGSTLLEQILSSHSQVDGTLELPNILSLSQRLRRQGRNSDVGQYPWNLAELSREKCREYGAEFIRDTRIHRQRAPFFIDKMPNNFRHIGLIRLILPNAKIIDARRDPMACCFSGYKQLFAEGQEFTYDLADIGQYYRDYVHLMDHWDEVLPGYVLRVTHEDVVDNLEVQVRRILDFCGLPFEEACLEFHRTERNIRTPSSEQVRQPINRSGLDYWRHYEPWLGPLKDALGEDIRRRFAIE